MKRSFMISVLIVCLLLLAACSESGAETTQQESEPPQVTETMPTEPADTTPPETLAAMETAAAMNEEELVGQMFWARCPQENAAELAAEYDLGGYVLFAADLKDKSADQVRDTIQSYQDASAIPMLIAVDEEGGTVTRVSRYPQFRDSRFQSPRVLYKAGGMERIALDTTEKAELLLRLGINVNLAPVCDLSDDAADFIYERSFGGDASATSEYVETVVTAMKAAGIGSCLKHFPGYGNNADTHTGIALDQREYSTFELQDFIPFEAGIKAGADCVLVSHNVITCMDEDLPASLSPAVHGVLRETLGFTGVIMTDDLAMDAITDYTNGEEAAVLAVLAGNDLLCCSDFETQIPAVLAALEDGQISREQLEQSVVRILIWKTELGLWAENAGKE